MAKYNKSAQQLVHKEMHACKKGTVKACAFVEKQKKALALGISRICKKVYKTLSQIKT